MQPELEPIVEQILRDASINASAEAIAEMLRSSPQQHAISNHLAHLDNPNIQLQDDRSRYNGAAIDLLIAYYRLELSPDLEQLLDRELAAGNTVREVSKGWPKETSIFIKFARPVDGPIPDWLERREINDPHYWKAEIYDARTGHLFAW